MISKENGSWEHQEHQEHLDLERTKMSDQLKEVFDRLKKRGLEAINPDQSWDLLK